MQQPMGGPTNQSTDNFEIRNFYLLNTIPKYPDNDGSLLFFSGKKSTSYGQCVRLLATDPPALNVSAGIDYSISSAMGGLTQIKTYKF